MVRLSFWVMLVAAFGMVGCGLALDLSDPDPDKVEEDAGSTAGGSGSSAGGSGSVAGGSGSTATTSSTGGECRTNDDCGANACNGVLCDSGFCVATPGAPCDDGIACTLDSCDPNTGCTATPVDSACDDRIDCTIDRCGEDGCTHTPSNSLCDGEGALCDPDEGCVAPPECVDHDECNNGNPCDGAEFCRDGTCAAGQPLLCAGPNTGCVSTFCDPTEGCVSEKSDDFCDDGASCTADRCQDNGSCTHERNDLDCGDRFECTDDACNPEHPRAGEDGCIHVPNDDACPRVDLACAEVVCAPSTNNATSRGCGVIIDVDACGDGGICSNGGQECIVPTAECGSDEACDDGDPCNGTEHCNDANFCEPGFAPCDVEDNDPCLEPVCIASADGSAGDVACATRVSPDCFDGDVGNNP